MREELTKEVTSIPEFELLPVAVMENDGYKKQNKFRAVVECGKVNAIAMVSNKYALVQMRDVFEKVLAQIEGEVHGSVLYYNGYGQMRVFPNDSNIGIAVINSVDRSSAIKIRFIINENGTTMYAPATVSEYKRLHRGRPMAKVRNFSKILANARETWDTIVNKLSSTPLTNELVAEVKEAVDAKRLGIFIDEFAVNQHFGHQSTLWDLLLAVFKKASESNFKTSLHREKRLQQLSRVLLAFAL